MDCYIRYSPCFNQLVMLLVFLEILLPRVRSNMDYSTLVYTNCASDTFKVSSASSSSQTQALESLFNDLISHSLDAKFFRTTAGDDQGGISGHYQCRRDITNHDCHSCVLKLPHITNTHCSRAIAAKIQLSGCSLNYEADSFAEATDQLPAEGIKYGMEHKVCSQERVETEGFNELRDSAFEELETGVLTRQGYCRANRESFQAVAQCDEDMGGCECGKCISEAVETVKAECKMAASGQVFLGRCSVSYVYGYHGEGFPFPGYQEGDEGGEHHTGRKIAIVLGGGAAAVLVGLILLALLGFGLKRKCFVWNDDEPPASLEHPLTLPDLSANCTVHCYHCAHPFHGLTHSCLECQVFFRDQCAEWPL